MQGRISVWTDRLVDNWESLVLPKTLEELEQIPLNQNNNFLMSLDRNSTDNEVVRIEVEAHMFWELHKH